MGADEPEEEERVQADPPASGQRADHEVAPPEVELPNEPDKTRVAGPIEDVRGDDEDEKSDDDSD